MFKELTIFFGACLVLLFICQILYWRIKKGEYDIHYSYNSTLYWLPAILLCSLGLISLIIATIQGQIHWLHAVLSAYLFIGFILFYCAELEEAPTGCQCVTMESGIHYYPAYYIIPLWLVLLIINPLYRLID